MAAGQTPGKCIKTWDSMNFCQLCSRLTLWGGRVGKNGQADCTFCLWECAGPADVQATLDATGLLEYITADIRQVDETDWAMVAQAAG